MVPQGSADTRHTDVSPPSAAPLVPTEYREILLGLDEGFCVLEILLDDSARPADYRFLEVNEPFERLTGLSRPVGRRARELVPGLEQHWVDIYGEVALTGKAVRFVQGSEALGRWFEVHASRVGAPERRHVALLFRDISEHRREQEERKRAEDALRASEHRFRSFADTAPGMLWVTEPDGRCSYLSRGWYEFTGQAAADGLGYGWLDAVHPADRTAAREMFLAANAARRSFTLEHRVRRADGEYRWVLDAGRPRLSAAGDYEGFVGSVIDIHDRRMAEERLDLAVNSGRVGLWYCDLPFDGLVWNQQVKEHFGLPADAEVTINTFFERLHPDDRTETSHAIEFAIANRTTFDTQYRTIGLDGSTRWVRAIGRARYDGDRPVRFDGITIDVTELVALRESAEAANRAKDEFLAMLGHELRNPLAPIITALQLQKLRDGGAVHRERAVIERQVRHLVGLVDDLLDVSRITRGRIELRTERLDLADIVAHAVELASPLLEQQRHDLQIDVPRGLTVDGDARRLAQVVTNLLTNAANYTEAKGRISVTAHADADVAVIVVRDTGVGIDGAMLPHIFDSFVQQRQTLARSKGGLGLGLTIVRSLVELHGGSVHASSEGPGRGAEFTVRLPRATSAPTAAPSPRTGASDGAHAPTGVRVLIVDDNEDAGELLGELLEQFGYDTRVVHDGSSALAAVMGFEPQFALIDIGLPVMDGFELAQRLRADTRLGGLTLVALTGYGQERDRAASAKAGFAAHIVKPVDIDALRAVIASLIEVPGSDPATP